MHSKIYGSFGRFMIFALLAGAGLVSLTPATSAGAPEAQGGQIEGSWYTQVTIRDCGTNAALRSFSAINTFGRGGTLIDTTAGVPPSLRSPGHGLWERTAGRTYRAMTIALLFNAVGVATGTQKLTQTIEIGTDRNTLNSTAVTEMYDTNGVLTSSGCATAVARIIL
jgi:hypothetical protein